MKTVKINFRYLIAWFVCINAELSSVKYLCEINLLFRINVKFICERLKTKFQQQIIHIKSNNLSKGN